MLTYRSDEVTARISSEKMLVNTKRGHTWRNNMHVNINRKNAIELRTFLCPKFTDQDEKESTVLMISANVKSSLQGGGARCWVVIDTDTVDGNNGRVIHCIKGAPHPINTDEAQMNFQQVLVPHDKVKNIVSKHVTLLIKATLVLALDSFEFDEQYVETDYCMIVEENCDPE